MKDYKIVGHKMLHDAKWLKLFELSYWLDGNPRKWIFASRKAQPFESKQADAVIIVAKIKGEGGNDKIVLTKEVRPVIWDGVDAVEYAFPAGLIDANETVEDAARREFKEETGLDLTKIKIISPRLYSSAGLSNECCIVVIGEAEGEVSNTGHEKSENIETILVGRNDLRELVLDKTLKWSAKSWPFALDFVLLNPLGEQEDEQKS